MRDRLPAVLCIGGWEPTGRMGLLADLSAVAAVGAKPLAVISTLTAQGPRFRADPVSAMQLLDQLRSALAAGGIGAIKLGVLPNLRLWRTAISRLPEKIPWVVDPVVVTSRGERLSSLGARQYLELAQPHVILTPNLDEAVWLLRGAGMPAGADGAEAAKSLLRLGYRAVVVKGGRGGKDAVDVVASGRWLIRLRSVKLRRTPEHRGTGCRFASALAAALALGSDIRGAAKIAKAQVRAYLANPA